MQLVQSGMLAALAALAIPIVIHLLRRRQARLVDLGTLQFLKVVLRDNARRRRLKRYGLLALRLACVALLALLFARPFLLADERTAGDHSVVVLVDRSASMSLAGGTRPIDRALAAVRSIAARAGSGSTLEIATFDQTVTPITNLSAVDAALATPLAGGTDDDAALAWARDRLVRATGRQPTLHILTDLQRSGLGRGDAARLPANADVHLVDLGRPIPRNIAVTGLAASPAHARPREPVVVAATIRNAGPLPATQVPVRLHLESVGSTPIDLDRTIDLDGTTSAVVEFSLPELDDGLWSGSAAADSGDDLPGDDRRYLAFAVAPAPRVLLVDGDPGRSALEAETYFLCAALRLAPGGETYGKAPFDPRVVDLFDLRDGLPDLAKSAAVVLANVADLPATDARALAKYVEGGGGLLVFTGDRVTAAGVASLIEAGLGVGAVGDPAVAPPGRPYRFDRWDAAHPLLRPFAEPEHGDLRRPAFTTITAITPDPAARVLAWFRGGEPALLERAVGRGRVVWFTSGCDRGWGDWPRGRMFLPMVHQMVAHAAGLTAGGPIRAELADATRAPGLVAAEGIIRVINPDPAESETARCTPREFADRYGFHLPEAGAEIGSSPQPARTSVDDRLRSDELWPWIALGLIGVLMVEQFLANRTAA